MPKACISHRCSSYTNIIHVQQVAIAQGLSPVLLSSQQSGEDVVTSIWEALTARGCVMCPPPNQPPQRALLCSVSAPNLLQAQEPKAKHVGAAGYNQYLFSRTESWNPRTGQAGRTTRAHLVPPPCSARAIPEHTQDCSQTVLEYLQQGRLHTLNCVKHQLH